MENTEKKSDTMLIDIIGTAVQIPSVRVYRNAFLSEQFKGASSEALMEIIEKGPVEANYSRGELRKMAEALLQKRNLTSTGASFLIGLPGGPAMLATVPADVMQFYGSALRLAQEISYLYGKTDLWVDDRLDISKVTNDLVLYCGVMLGASGAAQTVRMLSSALAKQMLKKIPQQALTKTFYYPIVKSIAKAFGAKMTKGVFAKGVSKAVPIVGGVVSAGITFATFYPMGMRLINALDEACFAYSEADFEADWNAVMKVCENEEEQDVQDAEEEIAAEAEQALGGTVVEKIQEAKQLLDLGVITENEFSEIKGKLIARI